MKAATGPTIGFVGLGTMGGPMALNLAEAGYAMVVHDVRHEAAERQLAAGARWAATPAELASSSNAIFTCLPTLESIETVALGAGGLIEGARSGTAFFETSTNSKALLDKLHAAFAAKGVDVLDAPISGGERGAIRGKMGIWVGGDRAAFDRFEAVLKVMGDHPMYVGGLGSGLVTKLVHNCASQATQAAIAEVFALGVKAGADPLSLWAAIRQGSIGRRRTFDGLIDQFLPGDYDTPQAALRIVEKDLQLATQLGRDLRTPMRFANLALADVYEALNRGWEERDCRSVMLLPQERIGVSIKVDREAIAQVLENDPPAPTDTRWGAGTS